MKPQNASLGLLGLTAVWGASFPLINTALRDFPPILFVLFRFTIAAAVLFAIAVPLRRARLTSVIPGLVCGTLLFLGFALQTAGLVHTTATRSAFITGLSVVLVPTFEFLFLGARASRAVLAGVVLSTLGLGLLALGPGPTAPQGNTLLGDLLTLACSVSFALHIRSLTRYGLKEESFALAAWQTLLVAVLALPTHVALEEFQWPTPSLWAALAFLAVIATSLVTVVQISLQRHVSATQAALIFAMEPVFAAIFAYFMQAETLGMVALVGCAAMVGGAVVASRASTPSRADALIL